MLRSHSTFYDRLLRLFKKHSDHGTKVSTVPSRDLLMKHLKLKIPFTEPETMPVMSMEDIVPKFSFLDPQYWELLCQYG